MGPQCIQQRLYSLGDRPAGVKPVFKECDEEKASTQGESSDGNRTKSPVLPDNGGVWQKLLGP
ncbi:MAG: hypothetical protein OXC48_00300 [Endozoicomonadaceae bacterium]|nr:hypothetical protein [Endozoicomonadaceae bacterium]